MLKESLLRRTDNPPTAPMPTQMEVDDEDTADTSPTRIADNDEESNESDESFSNYEEDLLKGLEPEEVCYLYFYCSVGTLPFPQCFQLGHDLFYLAHLDLNMD